MGTEQFCFLKLVQTSVLIYIYQRNTRHLKRFGSEPHTHMHNVVFVNSHFGLNVLKLHYVFQISALNGLFKDFMWILLNFSQTLKILFISIKFANQTLTCLNGRLFFQTNSSGQITFVLSNRIGGDIFETVPQTAPTPIRGCT